MSNTSPPLKVTSTKKVRKLLHIDQLQTLVTEISASTSAAEVEKRLHLVVSFYSLINYSFRLGPLFRARKCLTANGYTRIEQVGYPPPALTPNGRLNEAGKPMLYVSPNIFTVLEEVEARIGDHIHITSYQLKEGCALRCGLVGEIMQVHRWGRALSSEELGDGLTKILRKMSNAAASSFVFADSFLASILRDPNAGKDDYLKSRLLTRLLFLSQQNVEAIVYPSVAHHGAMNLAIKPSAVDEKLLIQSMSVVRVTRKYDFGIYAFDTVRVATGHETDGTIKWEAAP